MLHSSVNKNRACYAPLSGTRRGEEGNAAEKEGDTQTYTSKNKLNGAASSSVKSLIISRKTNFHPNEM